MANQPWYVESNRLAQENKILKELMISMADPLPPDGDTGRHKPDPNAPGSSPWRPGKSPAPSRPNIMAGLQINPNSIMLPFVPKDAETDEDYGEGAVPGHPDWKMAHGKFFNEYGQPIQDPGFGIDRGGNPIRLPHMEQTPEEAEQNRQLHIQKYHQAMAGPDYIGDKLRYGQLDRILNPLGDFRKPTLDQLRIHSKAYPKA